jgi:hypothetical protein
MGIPYQPGADREAEIQRREEGMVEPGWWRDTPGSLESERTQHWTQKRFLTAVLHRQKGRSRVRI